MVSFSCEGCNEVILKKKVAPHINWCHSAVTCIDCSQTFPGQTFKQHNQCITEDQKYQGKLYKKTKKDSPHQQQKDTSKAELIKNEEIQVEKPSTESKKSSRVSNSKSIVPVGKPVKIAKQQSLKKVLKRLRKEHKMKKSEVLDHISVTKDGSYCYIHMDRTKSLKAYRLLVRAARLAFNGDELARNSSRERIRSEFARPVVDHADFLKRLQLARDVAHILQCNVVQGVEKEQGLFKLEFHSKSELGDNDSRFQAATRVNPSGSGTGCCGGK